MLDDGYFSSEGVWVAFAADAHDSAPTVVEAAGATSLVKVGNGYLLGDSGPQLKIGGGPVSEGQFGGWSPVGVEQVGGGYQVAWKLSGVDQYQIWNADSLGNFQSTSGAISGGNALLQSTESVLQQDLNGDSTIGLATTVIESAGSTALTKIADGYFLGNSGPQLKIGGGAVTEGQFGGWSPVGAEQVSGGYKIAWKLGGADQYQVWNTDGLGNFLSTTGGVSGGSAALQSAETVLQQDLNGDGTTGIITTVIESAGSTPLTKIGDGYLLGGSGPQLKIGSASVTEGQFGNWAPIGAEQVGGGYSVAWKLAGADQYQVWSTDGSGNFLSTSGPLQSGGALLHATESILHQDLNGDGTTGAVMAVIESAGSTALTKIDDGYFLGGSGPQLKIGGASVTEGQFGDWAPVGAEQVGGGYRVAWKFGGADLYQIWATDSSGNFQSTSGGVPGASVALQSAETVLQQDLNGDGTTGLPVTTVESAGATALVKVGNGYFFGSAGGPQLKIGGAPVSDGQFGAWTVIGVEQVTGGYRVAWKLPGADQYQIWATDTSGNFFSTSGVLSGGSASLQLMETVFQQNLNGDGVTGAVMTPIESAGATVLVQVADGYFLGSSSGPQLKIGGSAVTAGQFGGWAPVGAEHLGTGYRVMWALAGSNQFQVWTTDANGNYLSAQAMRGTSAALQSLETVFQQDFNADGTTGLATTPVETAGSTALTQIGEGYFLGNAGPQLKIGGASVTVGQFGGWAPIGAEQISGGYQVAWKLAGSDQFQVWTTDASGNFLSARPMAGSSAELQFAEFVLQQDLNADGQNGVTVVDGSGVTNLLKIGNNYYLSFPFQGLLGPQLSLGGSPVTVGQFTGWQPLGVEQAAGAYQVVWKLDGSDQYQVWTVGSGGNYASSQTLVGTSTALESLEPSFQQDLNSDGTVGIAPRVIESFGTTELRQVGDAYFLGASGPQLKFNGAAVTPGEFPGWSPIGADAFRVVWKHDGTDEYKIWLIDSGGNYLSGNTTILSGATVSFQAQETLLQQDLNSDGTIGIKTTVIENVGSTVLTQRANTYQVDGLDLNIDGRLVLAGEHPDWSPFNGPGWSPIGAERAQHTMVWKLAGADQYQIWSIGLSGNYLSHVTTTGTSSALESAEATLGQDLNGDGTIGIATTVIESAGSTTLTRIADTYRIDSLTVKLAGSTVTEGQLGGWTAIGTEATADGYDLVWKNPNADQYTVWRVDSSGNYVSSNGTISGSTLGAGYYEYLFQQDLNHDGQSPQVTVIEAFGALSLVRAGNGYFMVPESGGIGVQLHRDGKVITGLPGQSGAWLPVAVEYDLPFDYLVLQQVGTNLFDYRIFMEAAGGDVGPWDFGFGYAAGSSEVMDLEVNVQQDLNGDGIVGSSMETIEAKGNGYLYRSTITDTYHLGRTDGPELKIGGVAVTGNDLWKPIAVWTPSSHSYVVALKTGTDQYQLGQADSAGNFTAYSFGILSGSRVELKIYETAFQQDLNGDGVVGFADGAIESIGSASLVKQGSSFYVYQMGSDAGVQLTAVNASGSLVNAFIPLGVDWTAEYGFQVVTWQASTGEYRVEDLDSAGAYKTNQIGLLSGDDLLLKTVESSFQQDFNRDGTLGLPSTGAFDIDMHFHGDSAYRLFFDAAAARWEQIITADLPDGVSADYGAIDDLRIDVTVDAIDGVGGILAGATWDELGFDSWMPIHGVVSIDSSDLSSMKSDGTLLSVITHEIGHVLGIGTLWSALGLTDSHGYVGQYGVEAYRQLSGNPSTSFVPLETAGGDGTAGVHWSESVFGDEMMTGFVSGPVNPLSILTIAALKDLGYSVDYTKADAYTLPA